MWPVLLFNRAELVLAYAAEGTYPILGEVFEGSAGSYPVVRIAGLRVIFISAEIANVLFHVAVTL